MPAFLNTVVRCTRENGHREYIWTITVIGQSVVPFIPCYGCCLPSDPWAFRTKHVYVKIHEDKRTVATVRFSTLELERVSDRTRKKNSEL